MTLDKWQTLSLSQQFGNIASEISRANHWQKKNDLVNRNKSLERSLELIDLTLSDKRHLNRFKEIARLREVVADLFAQTSIYRVTLSEIQNMLIPYALKARE